MIYTSLAVLALSASTVISSLPKLVHFHPHAAQPDTRIIVTLHNDATIFQDVKIDGRSYTIKAHQGLTIKAPAGTVIYSDINTGSHRRGQEIAQLGPELNQQLIDLK
jgi:hypothetical protein